MMPIGLALAGPISDTYGIQIWFAIGGILTQLMGIAGLMLPSLISIDEVQTEGVRFSLGGKPVNDN